MKSQEERWKTAKCKKCGKVGHIKKNCSLGSAQPSVHSEVGKATSGAFTDVLHNMFFFTFFPFE